MNWKYFWIVAKRLYFLHHRLQNKSKSFIFILWICIKGIDFTWRFGCFLEITFDFTVYLTFQRLHFSILNIFLVKPNSSRLRPLSILHYSTLLCLYFHFWIFLYYCFSTFFVKTEMPYFRVADSLSILHYSTFLRLISLLNIFVLLLFYFFREN